MLKVTLKKSMIGNTPANRATVHALGLRKIGQSNTFEATKPVLGMIHKVKHLLLVEEVEGETIVRRRKGHKAEGTTAAPKKESKKAAAPKEAAVKKAEPKKKSEPKAKAEDSKPKRTTRTKKSEE